MFNELQAQQYEMQYSKQWMNESFEKIMADIYKWRGANMPKPNPHYVDLFFAGSEDEFYKFAERVKDKTCLEVSSGPCGVFPLWGHWLTGRQIVIDPLIVQYDEYMKATFGKSWFLDRVEKLPLGAELKVDSLVGQVDGFIVWRNGIDHFTEWRQAVANISAYAADGCTLLFWGDHKHIETPDEGHNAVVTETAEELQKVFEGHGWHIIRQTPSIRDRSKTLDYGCVAVKGKAIDTVLLQKAAISPAEVDNTSSVPADKNSAAAADPKIKKIEIIVKEENDTISYNASFYNMNRFERVGILQHELDEQRKKLAEDWKDVKFGNYIS